MSTKFNTIALNLPLEITAEEMAMEAPIPTCDNCRYFKMDCHCLFCEKCGNMEVYCPCGFYEGVRIYANKTLIFDVLPDTVKNQGMGIF